MPKFSQPLFDTICERIANGESLRKISEDQNMPCQSEFYRWLERHEEIREQYARAREAQADTFADDVPHIADTEEDPNKARVRIDARKWAAGKLKPKKYGDISQLQHTGKDGGPIEINDLSPVERARRLAFILREAAEAQKRQETEDGSESDS